MRSTWPPVLTPGAAGGIRTVDVLPSAGEVALLDRTAVVPLVLHGPTSKAALLDVLATGLGFPAWFGRNWDALDELLRAPEPRDDRAIVIVWHHPDGLPAADRNAVVATFRSAAAARRVAGSRPLVVLVAATNGMEPMGERSAVTDARDDGIAFGPVHHVGIVVHDLDDALALYRDTLGLPLESRHELPADGVRVAFLGRRGAQIELVAPTRDDTGVARFLESRGPGLHHVCFEVADVAASLAALAADGLELIDVAPRRGAHGPVAFIHPRSTFGALIELIEVPGGPAWEGLRLGHG